MMKRSNKVKQASIDFNFRQLRYSPVTIEQFHFQTQIFHTQIETISSNKNKLKHILTVKYIRQTNFINAYSNILHSNRDNFIKQSKIKTFLYLEIHPSNKLYQCIHQTN